MSGPARPVFHTALAIVPPNEATECWTQLQHTRRTLRDKGFYRWPPHVNLVYPFVDSDRFEELAHMLTALLQDIQPFDIHLNKFGTFGGGKKGVCYAVPETAAPRQLSELYERVHTAVSQVMACPEPSRFVPHLTVAHTPTARDAQVAADAAAGEWTPTLFHVREIYILLRRPPSDQYAIACRIPLGGGDGETRAVLEPTFGVERFEQMPLIEEDWVKEVSKSLSTKGKKNTSKQH